MYTTDPPMTAVEFTGDRAHAAQPIALESALATCFCYAVTATPTGITASLSHSPDVLSGGERVLWDALVEIHRDGEVSLGTAGRAAAELDAENRATFRETLARLVDLEVS